MAVAKEISVDAAKAAALSALDGIFPLEEEQKKQHSKLFSADNLFLFYSQQALS